MKVMLLSLMLPLGVVLVLLATALYLAWGHRPRIGRVRGVVLAALVILYVGATPLAGRTLGTAWASLADGRMLNAPTDAHAVVVLTGNMFNAGAVGWLPSRESYRRVAVAYELQRLVNLRMPVIISGGYTHGVKAPSEAAVVAQFFANNRPEITPTELEESSTNTYESAMQLAPVLAKREARNVFLVTSDVHMPRALATFRARGVDAVPFPAMSLPGALGYKALLPSVSGLALTSDVLYEVYGTLAYLLGGRIGWSDIFYHSN
ncbi:MAG: YdcF family protein [Pseudomonadaceae bacterium]|nr:YdcF family protein [Pseudomonadaceae bacterium]